MLTEIASCLGKRIYRCLKNWFYRKISSSWNKKARIEFWKTEKQKFSIFDSMKEIPKKINKAILEWNTKIQHTHSYLPSNHSSQATPFHHSSLQLTVQFVAPIFSPPYYFDWWFINRSRNNLVSRAILFFATARFLVGPAWAPRIIHLATYFNINFPDGDTSFASSWPPISPELIIIRVLFCSLPLSCVRKVLFFFLFFCFFFRDEWWLFWKSKVIIILKLILSFETFLTKV